MGARIYRLADHVANQIAAGEVIERPVSVVKELLENARDAGATQISIEIDHGGLTCISVADNGTGIDPEDLVLAITPHATSKLHSIDDLYGLHTFGFRGEALASISSVSQVSIISRTAQTEYAHSLTYDGLVWHQGHCARGLGTTVTVRDLFYNMPVRKQFLKSPAQEYAAIEGWVKQFACMAPEIGLTLSHQGKKKWACLPAIDESLWNKRLQLIFGKPGASRMLYFEHEEGSMVFYGWMGHPEDAKNQYDKQWFFVNQRSIKDRQLLRLLRIAYEPYVTPGRLPNGIFYITLPPNEVDINIHPMKQEVRFLKERGVYDFVYATLARVLRAEVGTLDHAEASLNTPSCISKSQSSLNPFAPGWIVLNSAYACLRHDEMMYLVHVKAMRKKERVSVWQTMPRPWVMRSLLLPVTVAVEHSQDLSVFTRYRPLLESLGFRYHVEEESTLCVMAIPLELPMLDLQYVFSSLKETDLTDMDAVWRWLLNAEVWHLTMLSEDEHRYWQTYWLAAFERGEADEYTQALTETICDRWFLK